MSEHDEGSGFRIVDRRRFNADGTKRDSKEEPETAAAHPEAPAPPAPEAEPPLPEPAPRAPEPEFAPEPQPQPQPQPSRQAPPGSIDFVSFIASLATNAMAAMGVLPPEMSGDLPKNFDLAREYIDILAMLQEKTQGNLSRDEDAAMQRVLTDLRMAFVEVTRSTPPGE